MIFDCFFFSKIYYKWSRDTFNPILQRLNEWKKNAKQNSIELQLSKWKIINIRLDFLYTLYFVYVTKDLIFVLWNDKLSKQ